MLPGSAIVDTGHLKRTPRISSVLVPLRSVPPLQCPLVSRPAPEGQPLEGKVESAASPEENSRPGDDVHRPPNDAKGDVVVEAAQWVGISVQTKGRSGVAQHCPVSGRWKDAKHCPGDALRHSHSRRLATLTRRLPQQYLWSPLFVVCLSAEFHYLVVVLRRAEVEAVLNAQAVADGAPEVEQTVSIVGGEGAKAELKGKRE